MDRILNLQPSKRNVKDWEYGKIVKGVHNLPNKFSLEEYCGDIRDQGFNGFCHAFASCQLKNIQEYIETGHKYNFSPLAIAKYTKLVDKDLTTEGSTLISVMKALQKYGVIQEEFYPYEKYVQGSLQFPTIENENNIPHYKTNNYARCETVEDVKIALVNKKPVQIGYYCGENMKVLKDNKQIYIDLPFNTGLSGHSGTIIAYDDNKVLGGRKGYFKVTNSWGKDYGDKGFFWMPYDYINFISKDFGMKFVFDMFTTVDLKNDNVNGELVELFINKPYAYINGNEIELDQEPIVDIHTNRSLVPVRFISEVLGYKVEWYEPEKRITIKSNDKKITLYVDKKYAYINGEKIDLDKEPIVSANSDRALVPLRFVAEQLGCEVLWNGSENKIMILKR